MINDFVRKSPAKSIFQMNETAAFRQTFTFS